MDFLASSLPELHAAGLMVTVVLVIASLTDLREHKIYNWLTYPAVIWGLVLSTLVSLTRLTSFPEAIFGEVTFTSSLLGMLGCGLLMLVPYAMSGGGAGDVKLAMALGALLGFSTTLQVLCVGYLFASVYVAGRWVVRHASSRLSLGHDDAKRSWNASVPMAGFFTLGMSWVYFAGPVW
ncbi:MAG: A24 family peptidase [Planctomycetota bacterium]